MCFLISKRLICKHICERSPQLLKKNKLAMSLITRNKPAVCASSFITMCKLLLKEVKRNKKRTFWKSYFLKNRDSLTIVQDIRTTLFKIFTRMAPIFFCQKLLHQFLEPMQPIGQSVPSKIRLTKTLRFWPQEILMAVLCLILEFAINLFQKWFL